ncbi:hypothetical protein ACFQ3Z_08785 [Streptomyces nogalater]
MNPASRTRSSPCSTTDDSVDVYAGVLDGVRLDARRRTTTAADRSCTGPASRRTAARPAVSPPRGGIGPQRPTTGQPEPGPSRPVRAGAPGE